MDHFDRTSAAMMRPEIEKALADLGKKLGVEFTVGTCRYEHTAMRFNLEVAPADKTQLLAKEKGDFAMFASSYNLEASDFGREYTFKGEVFVIAGIDFARPKFSIRATRKPDGAEVFFPWKQVALQFHPEKTREILSKSTI